MSQTVMRPIIGQLKRSEWGTHLNNWKASSQSKAEYCRINHISYHAFNYWKKRLEKTKPSTPVTLVKLGEPKITPTSSPIRLWVNDIRIEVDSHFSRTSLIELIRVLRSI